MSQSLSELKISTSSFYRWVPYGVVVRALDWSLGGRHFKHGLLHHLESQAVLVFLLNHWSIPKLWLSSVGR